MTIVRVGTTKKYAEGWETAFAKGHKKAAPPKPAKKAAAKKTVKKSAKKKPAAKPKKK